jgi:hypothetical protein
MNAPNALKFAARRAARFNLWAIVVIIVALGVLAVRAAVAPPQHCAWCETALDQFSGHRAEKP